MGGGPGSRRSQPLRTKRRPPLPFKTPPWPTWSHPRSVADGLARDTWAGLECGRTPPSDLRLAKRLVRLAERQADFPYAA